MTDPVIPAIIAATVTVVATVWNYIQIKRVIRMQTNDDAKKLIHKCQFEKEFKIYTELWKTLVDIRNATAILRPEREMVDPSLTEEERRNSKIVRFNDAFLQAEIAFEHNRPFYSIEIYKVVADLLRLSRHEQIDYVYLSEERDREYWEKGKQNIEAICEAVNQVEILIRQRIEVIRVA